MGKKRKRKKKTKIFFLNSKSTKWHGALFAEPFFNIFLSLFIYSPPVHLISLLLSFPSPPAIHPFIPPV